MRIGFILLLLGTWLAAEERYCIEVMDVKDKKDISKEFIYSLSKSPLAYTHQEMDGRHLIFMGDFSSREEAKKALPQVQDQLNKAAFIRVYPKEDKTSTLSSKSKMQHAMLMAQAKMITLPKDKEASVKPKIVIKTVEIAGPKETKKPKINPITSSNLKKAKEKKQACDCKAKKKVRREHEIEEALEFYKASSFYIFSVD